MEWTVTIYEVDRTHVGTGRHYHEARSAAMQLLGKNGRKPAAESRRAWLVSAYSPVDLCTYTDGDLDPWIKRTPPIDVDTLALVCTVRASTSPVALGAPLRVYP